MNRTLNKLAEAKRLLTVSGLMSTLGLAEHAKKSAKCPFHEDGSASFSVFSRKDGAERWKCHASCGSGDAIDFLAKHKSLSKPEACKEYIRMAGLASNSNRPTIEVPTASRQPAFDWASCVKAMNAAHRSGLAEQRGYSRSFVDWLHQHELVGMFRGKNVAFPVHDAHGRVIGCHCRPLDRKGWFFHPTGTPSSHLVIGNIASAKVILAFESQWDLFAVWDRLGYHNRPTADLAGIATRGANNVKALAGLCPRDAMLYAFPQNDPAGRDWLVSVTQFCGCQCLAISTPAEHKDANDWTRAGASSQDLESALNDAINVGTPVATATLWSEPDEPEAMPFPVDSMPPAMAEMVAGIARSQRVPVVLAGVCALGVVSAALGLGLEVLSGSQRVTRGNLYILASAESGTGKSEVFGPFIAPMLSYERALVEHWRKHILPKVRAEIGLLDEEITALQKRSAREVAPIDRDAVVETLAAKRARKEELEAKTKTPCLIAQDITTERLGALLWENREQLFSTSPDARKVVDNLTGRYSSSTMNDESLYLQAFSGDPVRVERQGRAPVVLNKPCLAVLWLIQPDLLKKLVSDDSLSASGFFPRLLLCDTLATPSRIEAETLALPVEVERRWDGMIRDLLSSFRDAAAPQRITPTAGALRQLNEFHNEIVDRCNTDLADLRPFAVRYAEQAWRVAVVLHAGQWGAEAPSHDLSVETAGNAVRLIRWFAAQQQAILARTRFSAATKVEDEVQGLLQLMRKRKNQDFVTARDVLRARIKPTPDTSKALLAHMESQGLLTGEDLTPPNGGKTTRIFRVAKNPSNP